MISNVKILSLLKEGEHNQLSPSNKIEAKNAQITSFENHQSFSRDDNVKNDHSQKFDFKKRPKIKKNAKYQLEFQI